ncbi:cyclodeaminase/cyclohydrolase family protein [Haloechinothrix halophila]|uniref:cyclodeaminase/cyclohydrolase family protein n=1 Tax=Haloechinothrix halophila TaxID=1069073 RepID=UPI0005595449|nr:cyclodeaminase/cyclohydrolase family protein [Haloechinothrix halophila]
MRDETVNDFLTDLAARVPAPGGGATAALHLAQAAALVGMVARYSDGPRYAEHADSIAAIVSESDSLRADALRLAEEDAAAFSRVAEAYAMPKDGAHDRAARSRAIAAALVGACLPPADGIELSDRIVALAERLLPIGNRNVITDVAAAAEAARAGAATARVNIEVNLGGVTDDAERQNLAASVRRVDQLCDRADKVTSAVRARIGA